MLHRLAACSACGRQYDVSATPELSGLGTGETFPCSCGEPVTIPAGKAEEAAVVACSSCGAPREGQAESCSFCGSTFTLRELDLDAICPRCMARVSRRGRFCHHCSLPLTAPTTGPTSTRHTCPNCAPPPRPDPSTTVGQGTAGVTSPASTAAGDRGVDGGVAEAPGAGSPNPATSRDGTEKDRAEAGSTGGVDQPSPGRSGDGEPRRLRSRRIGEEDPLHLFECEVCAGLWLDREVFTVLVERAKRGRVALPGLPPAPPAAPGSRDAASPDAPGRWRYRPCAVCGNLMVRRNYGRRSGVILDLCADHGLWFDADELHRVLAWVKTGGSTHQEAEARERAAAEKARKRRGGTAPVAPFPSGGASRSSPGEIAGGWVLEGLARLVDALLETRWR